MSDSPLAVLFDMDGTLIDSEHLWLEAEIEVMSELGSDWNSGDQERCLGGSVDSVVAYMIQRSGTDRTPEEVHRHLRGAVERHMDRQPLTWRPGALDFLAATIEAGIPRALVTASWAVLVAAHLQRMRQELGHDPFAVIVAGDHITNSKPHPEPYLRAAALLGVQPDACLAIEDSPTGVRSAEAAGCVVAAVPHIAALPEDISSVHVIDTLEGCDPYSLWSAAISAATSNP